MTYGNITIPPVVDRVLDAVEDHTFLRSEYEPMHETTKISLQLFTNHLTGWVEPQCLDNPNRIGDLK